VNLQDARCNNKDTYLVQLTFIYPIYPLPRLTLQHINLGAGKLGSRRH